MPRGKQDPPESRDPREIAKLLKAIPKTNLGRLAIERYGSYKAFEGVVGFVQVGDMVKGNRRMTNAKLLKAASVLQVSPLYLLDLTDSMQPEASEFGGIITEANSINKALADDLSALDDGELSGITINYFLEPTLIERSFLEWRANGWFWIDSTKAVETVPPTIQNIRGDYRDLNQLTQDLLAMYPDTLAALLAQPPMRGSDQL